MAKNVFIDNKEYNVKELRSIFANSLMKRGIIVDITCSYWDFPIKIKTSELGLDREIVNFVEKQGYLKNENLLPKEMELELKRNKFLIQKCLEDHSFETPWGRFIPFSIFNKWKEESEIYKNNHINAGNELLKIHTELINLLCDKYKKMSLDIWNKLYPLKGKPTEGFLSYFATKIISKLPTKDEIQFSIMDQFRYSETFLHIPTQSLLEEINNINKEENLTTTEKKAKNYVMAELVTNKELYVENFLHIIIDGLRERVAKDFKEFLENINAKIYKKQNDTIRRYIDKIILLNFHNDIKLNYLLLSAQLELEKCEEEINIDIVKENISNIINLKEEFIPNYENIIKIYNVKPNIPRAMQA